MQNYYDILGVRRDATQEEIKNAYRKLAKKYHPDSSGTQDDREQFQRIQEAYAAVSDPKRRKMYDYYGHDAYRNSYYAQHAEEPETHTGSGCGHGGGDCGGCGHSDGDCGGCGHCQEHTHAQAETFRHVVRIAVWLEMEETFREVIKDAVLTEHITDPAAQTRTPKKWSFQVKLPANTYEKQFFLLEDIIIGNEELIEHLNTAYPENVYVVLVLLLDKPGYTRQAYHLYLDYPVDFHTLVLGGTLQIATLTGEISVDIPPGTSPERRIRIPGQGLNYPPLIGTRGDLYLSLHIRIPRSLTEPQRKAFEALRDALEA